MITVKIVKVPPVVAGALDIQPEIDAALETIGTRLERKGKGLGERRNEVHRNRHFSGQRISFQTLHNPRRTGRAKQDKMVQIFRGMAPRVVKSLMDKLAARWAGGT